MELSAKHINKSLLLSTLTSKAGSTNPPNHILRSVTRLWLLIISVINRGFPWLRVSLHLLSLFSFSLKLILGGSWRGDQKWEAVFNGL